MIPVFTQTIFPVFTIILVGYGLKRTGVIDAEFSRKANQLVFYLAIPAMLFHKVSAASFHAHFEPRAVIGILAALAVQAVIAWQTARLCAFPRTVRGTFIQSSFHGNLGYIAFAMAYYSNGDMLFERVAFLSSFLMIAHNILATLALVSQAERSLTGVAFRPFFKSALLNPVILSVALGVAVSAMRIPVPVPLGRFLEILSGMGLPTALLLIGSSLSFGPVRQRQRELVWIGVLKMVCFPIVGYGLLRLLDVPREMWLPVMILLAAPPATVSYVMASELGGDVELAAASISLHTLLSGLVYGVVLSLFG